MPQPTRRALLLAATLLPGPALAQAQAQAPAWPTRAVRIIVPFPPGAGTDLLARAYGQRLSELWGQPVVVENRAGAGGVIGAEAASRSPRDGYTILMANSSVLAIAPAITANLPYDPVASFDPIAMVGSNDTALTVRAASPLRSVADVVEAARARPGQLSYASAGAGTSSHMSGEFFKQVVGVDIMHVPYRGSPLALTDTLGGVVDMTFNAVNTVLPAVRDGHARVLATSGATRDPMLPEVPTFRELGITGYEVSGWQGFVVPAGTPPAIIARIAESIQRVGRDPVFAERIVAIGMRPVLTTPEEFRAALGPEIARWGEVARRAGLRPE